MDDSDKEIVKKLEDERIKGNFGKLILAVIGFFIIAFLIVVAYSLLDNSDSENTLEEPTQARELQFLLNYKGQDNEGSTVLEVIASILRTYETINHLPDQKYHWDLTSFQGENGNYDVDFHITTEKTDSNFQFTVDPDNNKVTSRNTLASNVLKVVEAEGENDEQEIDPNTLCNTKTRQFYEKLGMSDIYKELAEKHCSITLD